MTGLRVVVELQPLLFVEPSVGCFMTNFDCYQRIKAWLWVKNRVTPKWNPGKWDQGLQPAVP